MKLRVGDVLEVVMDVDSGVLSPGDRTIHTGSKRWMFSTRMPSFVLPLYDAHESIDPEDYSGIGYGLKVVGHLEDISEDVTSDPLLRPERREQFTNSLIKYDPKVREVWKLDLRYQKHKAEFDDLVLAILKDEPDLMRADIAWNFFIEALRNRKPFWIPHALTDPVGARLHASLTRLEGVGAIRKLEGMERYRVEEL